MNEPKNQRHFYAVTVAYRTYVNGWRGWEAATAKYGIDARSAMPAIAVAKRLAKREKLTGARVTHIEDVGAIHGRT